MLQDFYMEVNRQYFDKTKYVGILGNIHKKDEIPEEYGNVTKDPIASAKYLNQYVFVDNDH